MPKTDVSVYTPECLDALYDVPELAHTCKLLAIRTTILPERFVEINDVLKTFTVSGAVRFDWDVFCPEFERSQPFLSYIDKDVFWKPHISHKNSAGDIDLSDGSASRFFASNAKTPQTVTFYWQRFGMFSSACNMDFSMFPFDEHSCQIELFVQESAAAAYFAEAVIKGDTASFMPEGSNWAFLGWNTSIGTFNLRGKHSFVNVYFRFQRVPDFFVNTLLLPCVALISLLPASIAIPPRIPDRPAFAVTVLLALTVTQGQVFSYIPPQPKRVFLGIYMNLCVAFSWLCVVYSLISCGCSRTWHSVYKKPMQLKFIHWTLTLAVARGRFFDAIFFALSISIFTCINIYAFIIGYSPDMYETTS